MSIERIRVASSDWCPSRMVVSVISKLALRLHPVGNGLRAFLLQQVAAPIWVLGAAVPGAGLFQIGRGSGRSLVSGCPFTVISAI